LRWWRVLYNNAGTDADANAYSNADADARARPITHADTYTESVADSDPDIAFRCSFVGCKFFIRSDKLQRLPVSSILWPVYENRQRHGNKFHGFIRANWPNVLLYRDRSR
jgi:hypothetical protein